MGIPSLKRWRAAAAFEFILPALLLLALPAHSASQLPLTLPPPPPPSAASLSLADTGEVTDEIEIYSEWTSRLTEAIQSAGGFTEIYIQGGSSRAVLDHLFHGQPLTMRDYDLALVHTGPVTGEGAKKLGVFLADHGLGEFLAHELRERPRFRPTSPTTGEVYNAGFGFFLKTHLGIADLTLFHSRVDLGNNGLLDIDRVLIRVSPEQTLEDLRERVSSGATLQDLTDEGWVVDPLGGYKSWQQRSPHTVHPALISSDPYVLSLRVIRSFAKLGHTELPADLMLEISSALKGKLRTEDKFQVMRNLLKLLSDPKAPEELWMLWQTGYFHSLAPGLESLISQLGFENLKSLFARTIFSGPPLSLKRSDPASVQKWLDLAAALPSPEGLELVQLLSLVEPAAALTVLPQFLPAERPARIGYFTGSFDPFHHGHLHVLERAHEQMDLDLLLVLPVAQALDDPVTEQWDEREYRLRVEVARQSLIGSPKIFVHESPSITETTTPGQLIHELQSQFSDQEVRWFHIMGLDSYERFLARGVKHQVPTEIIVVRRPTYFHGSLKLSQAEGLHFLETDQTLNISSTMILQRLAAGEAPENLSEWMDPRAAKTYLNFEPIQKILAEIRKDAELSEQLLSRRHPQEAKEFIYIHFGDFVTLRDLEKIRFLLSLNLEVTVVLKSSGQSVSQAETSVYQQRHIMTLEEKSQILHREIPGLRVTGSIQDAISATQDSHREFVFDMKDFLDQINYAELSYYAARGGLGVFAEDRYGLSPLIPQAVSVYRVEHAFPQVEDIFLRSLLDSEADILSEVLPASALGFISEPVVCRDILLTRSMP